MYIYGTWSLLYVYWEVKKYIYYEECPNIFSGQAFDLSKGSCILSACMYKILSDTEYVISSSTQALSLHISLTRHSRNTKRSFYTKLLKLTSYHFNTKRLIHLNQLSRYIESVWLKFLVYYIIVCLVLNSFHSFIAYRIHNYNGPSSCEHGRFAIYTTCRVRIIFGLIITTKHA